MNHNQLLSTAKQTKFSNAKNQAWGIVLSSAILVPFVFWGVNLAIK